MFADDFCKQKRGPGSDHECDQDKRERVVHCGLVAALAMRKTTYEFVDARTEVDGKAQDRAKLDYDRVHLPISVAKVYAEKALGDAQVRGRAHRKKFGETFDDTQHD